MSCHRTSVAQLVSAAISYSFLSSDQVARLYGGIASLPTTFIIDQEGKIAAVHIGLVSKTNYASEILHPLATHDFAAPISP
jgi:peroxiredoxin